MIQHPGQYKTGYHTFLFVLYNSQQKFKFMTEEKYRYTSGNFLICDVQEEYAEYLLSVLVKHFGMQFQFHFFSDSDRVIVFEDNTKIEVLLIAEECYQKVKDSINAKKIFILTENMNRRSEGRETVIFRYQSAEAILHVIHSEVGEEDTDLGSASNKDREFVMEKQCDKPDCAKEERYDRSNYLKEERCDRSDCLPTPKKGKIRIRNEPDDRGVIGIYSPIHRIGKTDFALCLGQEIAEKVPTLYINMEGYSGNDFYFKGSRKQNLGDLLYYLKQERMDYGLRTSMMTGQYEKLDYIMPILNEKDLREVTKEEWIYLIDIIREQCIYEAVILDLGDCILGLYDILKKCNRIYTPYIQDEISMAKMRQYEENLKEAGYSEILRKTVKRQMRAK